MNEKKLSGRGPWIISGAVLLAALLIVGSLFYMKRQDDHQALCQAIADDLAAGMVAKARTSPYGDPNQLTKEFLTERDHDFREYEHQGCDMDALMRTMRRAGADAAR